MKLYSKLLKLNFISNKSSITNADYEFVHKSMLNDVAAKYFFSIARGDNWLQLAENEINLKLESGNSLNYIFPYIFEVANFNPFEFIKLINKIGSNLNYYAFVQIIKIACRLDPNDAVKLKDSIQSYLNANTSSSIGGLSEYIDHISNATNGTALGLDLIKGFVYFKASEQVQSIETDAEFGRKSGRPIIGSYEYQEFLQDVVKPYAEIMPLDTSMLLIDAMKSAVEIEHPIEDSDNETIQDYSEIWCVRLDEPSEYEESKASLAHVLTYSCEQVFVRDPSSIDAINDMLLLQPWHIFTRLRQHLYALNPTEQTKPWIRDLIFAHKDYANSDIHFELQQMIRSACDKFGNSLLSEAERRSIFDAILNGPSKSDFKEWLGDKFTDEIYIKRQNNFQLKQLKPFENVFFGEYLTRFNEISSDETTNVSEDDYSPYKSVRGGFVSKQSPKPADDLATLDDSELLVYINEWQSEHRDPDNWLIEIDISALADAFKIVFITNIFESKERFEFWMENVLNIQRPIYVRTIVNAFAEQFQANNYDKILPALALCNWVLTHQDLPTDGDNANSSEESNTRPDWSGVRRAVCDLIDVCLAKDSKTPILVRDDIESILESLCLQHDRQLDRAGSGTVNIRDYLSVAINNTRSRALEDLINYGYWLRRHDKDAPASVVFDILEKRLGDEAEIKLTIPEHALLGLNFGRLAGLDEAQAKINKDSIFPKDKPETWSAAFGNLLRYSQPYKLLYNLLEDDYWYALDFIKTVEHSEKNDRDWTDTLGQHLFSYALWGVFQFQGEESLLEQYYKNTQQQPEHWSRLFNHVGRSLKNAGNNIKDDLKLRVYEFIEWRLEQKSKIELKDFSFWLGAECLDAKWRLETFSKVLDISPSKDVAIYTQIEELNKMLGDHAGKVVECFAKLMQGMSNLDFIYIQADKAKPILAAGLNHTDETVKGFAEQARESLLRAGHFEFLE